MRIPHGRLASQVLVSFALLLSPTLTFAQHYVQNNLVADSSGINTPNVPAIVDGNLINAWGLTRSVTSPWWVADNGAGVSTLYSVSGSTPTKVNITVTIPPPPKGKAPSAPTGVVFNGNTNAFFITPNVSAKFIFVTEDGTIAAWNSGATATIMVNNSPDAVYKGATIAEMNGKDYLYVTNFRSGRVEVYDSSFTLVHMGEEAFDDDQVQPDFQRFGFDFGRFEHHTFAPFNVQAIGDNLYVTYAEQDAPKHDDVAGAGLGFVDVYSTSGKLLARLQHGPWFNSPWGVASAPGEFGEFSHAILIGNFGSGQIAAFNAVTGRFIGLMENHDNSTLTIDGLWALGFGNGASAGPYNTLFFTAGPNNESDGLFGTLLPDPGTAELSEDDEP